MYKALKHISSEFSRAVVMLGVETGTNDCEDSCKADCCAMLSRVCFSCLLLKRGPSIRLTAPRGDWPNDREFCNCKSMLPSGFCGCCMLDSKKKDI